MINQKEIIIKAIDKTKKEYLAFYKNDLLKATFSVFFNDSIVGAVSLTRFFEMIQYKFGGDNLEIVISNDKFEIKNPALLELLTNKEEIK